ncbi:MAG TPA: DinB family protein [Candidatus Acidoferrum sp.]|nr:DinB family protein [Candidatus Acidoferrum sp.]
MRLLRVRFLICVFVAGLAAPIYAQTAQKKPTTLRAVLLAELKSTHNSEEWFVPVDVAVKGLTPEQAAWRDAKGNHSVGQLVYHLWFWDTQSLHKLKGEPPEKFSGNNDDTFNNYDPKRFKETVTQLDEVLTGLEQWIATASPEKLAQNAQTFTHISTHNAYHIGEMVLVRKEQGSWNPANGVH